jgi:hypothetical protein
VEVALAGGARLVVEFFERGDRLAHVVSWVSREGQKVDLLESIEGSPVDDWPTSPPLQSLSLESLTDGRRVAFLVGMAGRSHWSASVEPLAATAAIAFDIACRHSAAPGWLGSQYRALETSAMTVQLSGKAVITQQGELIHVAPQESPTAAGTTRWQFQVLLNSSAIESAEHDPGNR